MKLGANFQTGLLAASAAAGVGAAAAWALGAHMTERIRREVFDARPLPPPPLDIVASPAGPGRVSLRPLHPNASEGDWKRPGVFGIAHADGYGQVGKILDLREGRSPRDSYAVREYRPGAAAVSAPTPARLDLHAYDADPLTAHGIAFQETAYPSELGECPAWFVPGASGAANDTWMIFAHGRGALRSEALRILPAVADAGHPALIISYRNDDGAAPNPDGCHWLGLTEWRDLHAAAQFALDRGAKAFILFGYSMGGGVIMNFLYKSHLARRVKGVALDCPLLDFAASIEFAAARLGYPGFAIRYGKAVAGRRLGIDWGRMNYLSRASELAAPMLLLHGEDDSVVPAATSKALAQARPDIVRYVGFDGAEHARAWNAAPQKYEAELRDFLAAVQAPAAKP